MILLFDWYLAAEIALGVFVVGVLVAAFVIWHRNRLEEQKKR